MPVALPVCHPFSFAQTLAFLQRFPPCQHDYLLTADSLTAAVTLDGRPVPFTIRGGAQPTVEVAAAGGGQSRRGDTRQGNPGQQKSQPTHRHNLR